MSLFFFFFSSRRRHTRSLRDWSSDVCSSDLLHTGIEKTAERNHLLPLFLLGGLLDAGVEVADRRRARAYDLAVELEHERSEERRVGKECRYRWAAYHEE